MNCPYCGSNNTFTYYEANMPNILSACPAEMLKLVKVFPFSANLCKDCMLGYNSRKLDDNELTTIYDNYIYISTLQHGIGHTSYNGILKTIQQYCTPDDKIVDIGSADGYLLKVLNDLGYKNLLGIEPGPQAEEARKLGLNIMNGYFNADTFEDELFDVFVLSHVFEHFSDPFSVLEAIKKNLAPNGKIIIEVPYFNGYHHQHLFFYNLSFLKRLCKDKACKIIAKSICNGILRVVITHNNNEQYCEVNIEENQNEIVESAVQLYDKFKMQGKKLNEILKNNSHKKVYWWGTGILSVLYLNQIERGILENIELVILDGDENKVGSFVPGVNIKVNYYEQIKNSKVDLIIIASTFYNEIADTMKRNNIIAEKIETILV